MNSRQLHRFEVDGKRFALDPETCFCFECDAVSWDVLAYYPHASVTRILHELEGKYPAREIEEVVGELEWLRGCNSILPAVTQERLQKQFEAENGLRLLVMAWPEAPIRETLAPALLLFISRAGSQPRLRFVLECQSPLPPLEDLAWATDELFRAARFGGKQAEVTWRVNAPAWTKLPDALAGHALSLECTLQSGADTRATAQAFRNAATAAFGKVSKCLPQAPDKVQACLVIAPGGPDFCAAIAAGADAGFSHLRLDMEQAFVRCAPDGAEPLFQGLAETARFYATQLRNHRYFRLDPIAELFHQIYVGQPLMRHDPSGTNALAIDAQGRLFPSLLLRGQERYRVGDLRQGALDEARVKDFEDLGAVTTPACMSCWARFLCGGGPAAVHEAYSGSFRRPHEAWCNAQRDWMAQAVAAFSALSLEGVNFSRMYQSLIPVAKPSWRHLVKAAFRLHIGLRPIEENDAEWLTRWENWNESAYFLSNESGLLMATQYDREMDSLHPRGYESEFVLVHKDSTPFGLLKIRPDRTPGAAWVWLYFRKAADYRAESVRGSFRFVLGETAQQQQLKRLMCPVAPWETDLAAFLAAAGFRREGVQREALYLHGKYHDVAIFVHTVQA